MSEDALKNRGGLDADPSNGLTHDVLFMDDVAHVLRTSRSTIERRRRAGTFPIPELPSIDERPRWSRHAVERYLASSSRGVRPLPRRRTPRETHGKVDGADIAQ